MYIRNWVQLAAFILIILAGVLVKRKTTAMVKELDGVGEIRKKQDIAGDTEQNIPFNMKGDECQDG